MKHLAAADGSLTAVQEGQGPDLVILHSLLTDRRAFDAILPPGADVTLYPVDD